MRPALPVLVLDGRRITNTSSFYDEVERVLIPDVCWGRNLDAFRDILGGGFGTPECGFTLLWRHSDQSRLRLGRDTFETLVSIVREYEAGSEFEPYCIDLKLE